MTRRHEAVEHPHREPHGPHRAQDVPIGAAAGFDPSEGPKVAARRKFFRYRVSSPATGLRIRGLSEVGAAACGAERTLPRRSTPRGGDEGDACLDLNPRPEPQRRHAPRPFQWYNSNTVYKMLDLLERHADADGVAAAKKRGEGEI